MRHIYEVKTHDLRITIYSSRQKAHGHFACIKDCRIEWLDDMAIVWDLTKAGKIGTITKRRVF